MSFMERKQARIEYFERFVKGWKIRNCIACAGSGYYDGGRRGTKCGACSGTGKERYKPEATP